MKSIYFGILLISISSNVSANERVMEFFDKYILLDRSFDPAIGQYYSDEATLTITQIRVGHEPRSMQLTGSKLKAILPAAMPIARATNDRNKYSDIRVEKETGDRFKISASRYSEKKCYLDENYFMVVVPNENSGFIIIEESAVSQQHSSC